jgi:hypothetical protein
MYVCWRMLTYADVCRRMLTYECVLRNGREGEQECAAIFALLYEVKQVNRVPAASVFVLTMYK